MRTLPTVLLCSLLAACATTSSPKTTENGLPEVSPPLLLASPELTTSLTAPSNQPVEEAPPLLGSTTAALPQDASGSSQYLMLKGGYYGSELSGTGDGYIINLAYGRPINKLLGWELEAGYFEPDVTSSNAQLWGVPLMLNGRVTLPVWILEVYGGAGIGTIYYDLSGAGAFNNSDWLFAGNAFLGADITLIDKLTAGLEFKYYLSESASSLGGDSLDAYAVMLMLGLRF